MPATLLPSSSETRTVGGGEFSKKGKEKASDQDQDWLQGLPMLGRDSYDEFRRSRTISCSSLNLPTTYDPPVRSSLDYPRPKQLVPTSRSLAKSTSLPLLSAPSPIAPTSPVTSITSSMMAQSPAIASFFPKPPDRHRSSSPPPPTKSTASNRRSSTFSVPRLRKRSNPRKPASIRRSHSPNLYQNTTRRRPRSLHSRTSSTSTLSIHDSNNRKPRPRSASVPDLRARAQHARSRSVPIPFDTFEPRSPYTRETDQGGKRRPSIADELLSLVQTKESSRSGVGDYYHSSDVEGREGMRGGGSAGSIVFPSRKYSSREKGKGRGGGGGGGGEGGGGGSDVNDIPLPNTRSIPIRRDPPTRRREIDQLRSRSVPIEGVIPPVPTIPPRPHELQSLSSKRTVAMKPTIKGSLMVPHPKLVVSDLEDYESLLGSEADSIEQRYERRRRESTTATRDDSVGLKVREEDGESIDHSSLVRVLRENEESRKEREAWSDSATKTLGLGLGLKLAEFERKRSVNGKVSRGPGNMAIGGGGGGGGGGRTKDDRKKARKAIEEKKRLAAAAGDSETETEGRRTPRRRQAQDQSPPMPHSFEPFVQLRRKLSLSRTRSRERGNNKSSVMEGYDTGSGSMRRGSVVDQAGEGPSTPRTVQGKPIRHLRASNSVDSLHSRNTGLPPALPTFSFADGTEDSATQYGQALTFDNENVPINVAKRRPSLTTQNAFLSLPPHLHHLLRSPERDRYTPSRQAPPVPATSLYSVKEQHRLSTSSVASAARLSLALETHLLRTSNTERLLTPLSEVRAKTPQVQEQRLGRSISTPAFLSDVNDDPPSVRVSPLEDPDTTINANGLIVEPSMVGSKALSPIPASESPESQRTFSSVSTQSSMLHIEDGGNWKELFFSPPRPHVRSVKTSGSSRRSFIDFQVDDSEDEEPIKIREEEVKSPMSFLDDFSPPSSASGSPVLSSFSTIAKAPVIPDLPDDLNSLPVSPTFSHEFDEESTSQFVPSKNRQSHLSVNSNNMQLSPVAATKSASRVEPIEEAREDKLDTSFLDVSDDETNRLSRQSFRTFFSGGSRPLPTTTDSPFYP